MEWMIMPLKRYADFSGRSRRLEYWMFVLFIVLAMIAMTVVFIALAGVAGDAEGPIAGALVIVIVVGYLGLLIPILAVQVRRFHDQDLSGWFVLLGFIPYLGGLIMLVFMCIDGTAGPNRFGPDPKGRGDTLADVFT